MDYLIKFGNTPLPNRFITADGYVVTPNRRTELEAYRDANIELHRTTSPNYKTSIQLTLCPMKQADKEAVQQIIFSSDSMINMIERKVRVTYWNDEVCGYSTGYFYISDVTYTPLGNIGGEHWYKSVTYQLTEY